MKAFLLVMLLLLGASPVEGSCAPGRGEIEVILDQIKAEEDKVDSALFEQLGSMGNEASFEALQQAVGYLRKRGALNRAYQAFRHYGADDDLGPRARAYLKETVMRHRRQEDQLSALSGLKRFGEEALPDLEWILQRHRDQEVRRSAIGPLVPLLGERGDAESAQLLLDLATISKTGAYENVRVALVKCDGPKVRRMFDRCLRDRDGDPSWRLLILDVISESEGKDIDKMIRGRIDDTDHFVCIRAVELVGRRGDRAALTKLMKLLRWAEAELLTHLIVAVSAMEGLDERWNEQLEGFARDEDFGGRMGAATALGALGTQGALELLHEMLGDEDWRIRAEVLERVGGLREKETIPELIVRLGVERGRLKGDVAKALRLFTGQDHGMSELRWGNWWRDQGQSFQLPTYEVAVQFEQERMARRASSTTQATFYGLQVHSKRVAFALDVSGSMNSNTTSEGPNGERKRKRIEVAVEELSRALAALEVGVLFNVIFFSTNVDPWLDELIAMEPEVRADALEYVARQKAGGATNVFESLMAALADQRVDTIYLLTDGMPSSGAVRDPRAIRDRISRINVVRKVKIHCVSVGRESAFLKGLAADTGGEYVVAR